MISDYQQSQTQRTPYRHTRDAALPVAVAAALDTHQNLVGLLLTVVVIIVLLLRSAGG